MALPMHARARALATRRRRLHLRRMSVADNVLATSIRRDLNAAGRRGVDQLLEELHVAHLREHQA